LQEFLNNNGYTIASSGVGSKGRETTIFGNLTQAALKRYQSANGLTVSGIVDSLTRAKMSGSVYSGGYTIAQLQEMILALQQQIAALLGNNSSSGVDNNAPYITSIKVSNEGDDDYIDKNDQIVITFSEEMDPESFNNDLENGDTVSDITFNETGGVSVSSSGKLTVKNITSFYVGDVENSSLFVTKLAMSSSGKVLTVTLTSGSDVEITDEELDSATQLGGVVTDAKGNVMEDDDEISDPTGTFGGDSSNNDNEDSDTLNISSIVVYNNGEDDYIDTGDEIKITFTKAVKPYSINDDLDYGDTITGIAYSDIGGVSVSSSGKVTIKNIAYFDMGSVEESGTFTSKMNLSSSGKVLTITLTSGPDIEITNEDFGTAYQLGGTVEDEDGNEMEADSSACEPSGSFGGNNSNDDEDNSNGPSISSIVVSDGGEAGYIDEDDSIKITFNQAIDPSSINSGLDTGDYVSNVSYSKVGGVSVSSAGKVTVKGITAFDMGTVDGSGTFYVKLALNSTGKILTITLTDGDRIEITDEDFDYASQTSGYVQNNDGDEMEYDSSACKPTGTFGGSDTSDDGPVISSITVYSGGDDDEVIDEGDYIRIIFSKALKASSVNSSLDIGKTVTGLVADETGGVRVSSSGVITIKNIATFDVGSVDGSGSFETSAALSSDGDTLTITITNGGSIEITDEDYGSATQTAGTIEDEDGNEMQADSSIDDPTGGF